MVKGTLIILIIYVLILNANGQDVSFDIHKAYEYIINNYNSALGLVKESDSIDRY